MLRRLILHLGMGKTGSTTIQSFLKKNRALLRRDGFLAFTPNEIQPCPHRGLTDSDRAFRAIAEVKRRLAAAGADSLIWSLEGFGTRQFAGDRERLDALKRELAAEDVRVVVYLRRQDTFAPSAYLQWNVVHKGYKGPIKSFDERFPTVYGERPGAPLEETNLNFYEVVRPWVETFGLANVRVRPLERAQLIDNDLLKDFQAAASLEAGGYDFDIRKQNVTFNMELSDMLGMYASTFDGPVIPNKMDGFFNSFGNDDYFSQPFFTRYELPPLQRRGILEACRDSNARVAREFLGRADGVLFAEPWPDVNAPHRPYKGMTLDRLVPILMHILQKQHQRINALTAKLDELTSGDGKDES